MENKKTINIKNGKQQKQINLIIHNPNTKKDFDKYYTEVIIDTVTYLINK